MNTIHCITDSDEHRFKPEIHTQNIEDHADNMLSDCLTVAGADAINQAHDLYDGLLLPQMMSAVANWRGSTESSAAQMRVLHNLLTNALQAIAERGAK